MLGNGMLGFRNLYLYSAPAVVIVWIIYYLIHGKHQKSSSKFDFNDLHKKMIYEMATALYRRINEQISE